MRDTAASVNDSAHTADTTYIDLLLSLPELKSPFVARQLPISRWQLGKRLGQLSPAHRRVLDSVCNAMQRSVPRPPFEHLPTAVDRDLPGSGLQLQTWCEQWGLADLYTCLQNQLDRRCLLAALRRRQAGAAAPTVGAGAGLSACVRQVVQQWSQPHFQLQHRFPWLPAVRELLESGDTAGLERLLVQHTWDDYSHCWERCCRVGYEHNLAAVIVYVLRWQLVDDWLAQSAERSAQVFEDTVTALTGAIAPAVTKDAGGDQNRDANQETLFHQDTVSHPETVSNQDLRRGGTP
ncbi:hypothetical protein FKG94_22075 [Exilibacterium tricleocarpae]|uniref:DUF2764 family protein n=1 Tax=Exilibacterium tricleocarpae TaxID=2591008 RepID=A0A545SZ05_9GAMM|nr:hypothetical protein [Exilibacterium tricleocarpae]TQV70205.1 hypothetical protein FKG94_22075 [Exilibacterium tricleocarpae]